MKYMTIRWHYMPLLSKQDLCCSSLRLKPSSSIRCMLPILFPRRTFANPNPPSHHTPPQQLRTSPLTTQQPTMPTIYLHPDCPTYALSPLLMLTHLQTSHAASTARTLALHGQRGLNPQLLKHTLHWTPRACTPVFPCTDCSVLFYTPIEAHMHLLSAPEHVALVAAVRESQGEEGVGGMVRSAWLERADVSQVCCSTPCLRLVADMGRMPRRWSPPHKVQ